MRKKYLVKVRTESDCELSEPKVIEIEDGYLEVGDKLEILEVVKE